MINDGVLAEKDEIIVLTLKGMDCLNRHYIDYQIDLISLSKNLGSFYKDKISELVKKVELPAALYGASDTLKSFFPFLKKSGLEFQCVIDDDPKKQNSQYLHLLVIDLRELTNYDVKTILISSIEFQNKIKDKIDSTYPNKYIVETIFD